jgi:hypothetical protein
VDETGLKLTYNSGSEKLLAVEEFAELLAEKKEKP